MKTFIHPGLLRTILFDQQSADNFFRKIRLETACVEFLMEQGLPIHVAYRLVSGRVN